MMKGIAALTAALGLAACASVNRVSGYEILPMSDDARNFSTAFVIHINVHPTDDTLLFNARADAQLVDVAAPGEHLIRRVGEEFLGDTGCALGEVRSMARPWFEAAFACPADFDLRAAMAAQRAALRGGAPLQRVP